MRSRLLVGANVSMVVTLILFLITAYCAWFLEADLPLMLVAVLHLLQIVLAGLFKLSYVFRLIAQDRLGLKLR